MKVTNLAKGVANLPYISDNWTRESMLRIPWFPSVMSHRTLTAITRFLHFANNTTALTHDDPSYDRLRTVRKVIEILQRRFQELYTPGMCVSIDESMIGSRARLSFLQYLPKKPMKWGIKVWVCAEAKTGYIHTFDIYTGQGESCEHGLG